MDLMDVIRRRRSIRRFRPDPVPPTAIEYVLEAARLAPSWANGQCWSFVVVTDAAVKHALAQAGNEWIEQAPAIVVFCADPKQSGTKADQPYYLLDIGIAMEHLVLAAAEQGLGTCWIGWFDEEKARQALHVPDHLRVGASTPLGYPDEEPEARPRKKLSDLVHYNGWE